MKFGTKVIVTRGSEGNPPGSPGCLREVRGILIGAYKNTRRVRLTESDPLEPIPSIGWSKPGDVGNWATSQVREDK